MGVTAAVKPESSPAPFPAGPTHTHLQTHLLSVEDMLKHVKQNKLTEGRPLKPQPQRLSTSADNVSLVGENSGRIKWIQPSGMQPEQYWRSHSMHSCVSTGLMFSTCGSSHGAVMVCSLLVACCRSELCCRNAQQVQLFVCVQAQGALEKVLKMKSRASLQQSPLLQGRFHTVSSHPCIAD